MNSIITKDNLHLYLNDEWFFNLSDKWRYIFYNAITKNSFNRKYEAIFELRRIECNGENLYDLEPLKYCVNLEYLNCSSNNLNSLKGLKNCRKLKNINCQWNSLISLNGIENCSRLELLRLSFNYNLIDFRVLRYLFKLKEIHLTKTNFSNFELLKNCYNLSYISFDCDYSINLSYEQLILFKKLKIIRLYYKSLNPTDKNLFNIVLKNVKVY